MKTAPTPMRKWKAYLRGDAGRNRTKESEIEFSPTAGNGTAFAYIKCYPASYLLATQSALTMPTKLLRGTDTAPCGCNDYCYKDGTSTKSKLAQRMTNAIGKKVSFRWGDPIAITGKLRTVYKKLRLFPRESRIVEFPWAEVELRDGTIILANIEHIDHRSFRVRE